MRSRRVMVVVFAAVIASPFALGIRAASAGTDVCAAVGGTEVSGFSRCVDTPLNTGGLCSAVSLDPDLDGRKELVVGVCTPVP